MKTLINYTMLFAMLALTLSTGCVADLSEYSNDDDDGPMLTCSGEELTEDAKRYPAVATQYGCAQIVTPGYLANSLQEAQWCAQDGSSAANDVQYVAYERITAANQPKTYRVDYTCGVQSCISPILAYSPSDAVECARHASGYNCSAAGYTATEGAGCL